MPDSQGIQGGQTAPVVPQLLTVPLFLPHVPHPLGFPPVADIRQLDGHVLDTARMVLRQYLQRPGPVEFVVCEASCIRIEVQHAVAGRKVVVVVSRAVLDV